MEKYTKKITVPQYEPKGKVNLDKMFNTDKYESLLYNIDNSSIGEFDKKFLKLAATRHIEFNYSEIAEYYCQASPEIQKLMEESALVIIDVDDAIANGYIKLNSRIQEIVNSKR